MDEEILQDFLVEAGELYENLNEQLVELERDPHNADLLNAIFRGFHTIKGGAGFIGVTPLVELCHRAENLFDKIRNGEREYAGGNVDVVLQAYDVIGRMIQALQAGERELEAADASLLAELDAAVKGEMGSSVEMDAPVEVVTAPVIKLALPEGVDPDGEISDEEFEALLNQRDMLAMAGQETAPTEAPASPFVAGLDPDGEITDEEFEAMLAGLQSGKSAQEAALDAAKAVGVLADPKPAAAVVASPVMAEPVKPVAPAAKPAAKPAVVAKAGEEAESTVRVDTKRLDEIMNLVGELVLVRNRLLNLRTLLQNEEVSAVVANLDHVTMDLQASVMKTRMQPVKKVFSRFPRVVRDLARKLGKEIELELEGEDTDLDKNLVEALADPLVHLVRNAVDHGVEDPQTRESQGKSRVGKLILSAQQEGDHILLTITDDGKGMNADFLRQKAIEKGLIDEMTAAQLDDKSAFELILLPGFSTKTEISDVSGRGVGMDVVKSTINKLNGSIDIHSVLGEGTIFNIRVPLTLAILPTLMVGVGAFNYAIPLTAVQEIFDYDASQSNRIDGRMMVRLRSRSIPLYFMRDWLSSHTSHEPLDHAKVVIVNIGTVMVGLIVDHVRGQEEVVIKPLGAKLQGVQGYAGATITGDGRIALILDLPGMMNRF
ncbi:MAG TPA: chemotaxis protein CheA [Thiotrichales bacterium]|nr:MAG: chemotaxis protein CheA [Thiotrichales bacterium 35-46-9]HQR82237.1 chemotaxis protein CheA [Thiotrichales bacterium]